MIEEAVIDASGRVMTTYTRNIGLRFFMGTTEKVGNLTLNINIHENQDIKTWSKYFYAT